MRVTRSLRPVTTVLAVAVLLLACGAAVASAARPVNRVSIGPARVFDVAVTPNSRVANYAVIGANARVRVTGRYSVDDNGCPGCADQIQIGWAGSPTPLGCIYAAGAHGSGTFSYTLGQVPAGWTHDVVVDFAQGRSCPTTGWWNGNPGPAIAEVVARPPTRGSTSAITVTRVAVGAGATVNVLVTPADDPVTVSGTYSDPAQPGDDQFRILLLGWASSPDDPGVCVTSSGQPATGSFSVTLPPPPAKGADYVALAAAFSSAADCSEYEQVGGSQITPPESRPLVGLVYDPAH